MKLIENKNNQAVTTSLQVAETFGKKHKIVLKSIEDLLANGVAQNYATPKNKMFAKGTYKHPQNHQEYPMYYMNKDGFTLLAFGFTGKKANEFKLEYIKAFNEMEEIIKNDKRLPQSPEEMLALTMNVTNRTVKRVESIEKDVNDLKNNVVIDSGSYAAIGRLVSRRVYEFLDERRYQHNRENVSALFSDINHGIKQVTGVRTRSQIKSKDFEKVMQYIDAWEPATATKMELINKKVGA